MLSLLPVPGGVDLVVASELLEAGRIVGNGYVSPDRTLLITSTSRTLTTAEKMALGDGRFDSGRAARRRGRAEPAPRRVRHGVRGARDAARSSAR